MHWIDKICSSYLWAIFLCGLLFFSGFLFGSAWSATTFLDIADKVGSFVGGIGTIAAVLFAATTYKDWKKYRRHELAVEACHNARVMGLKAHRVTMPLQGLVERMDVRYVVSLRDYLKNRDLKNTIEDYLLAVNTALQLHGRLQMLEPLKKFSASWGKLWTLFIQLDALTAKDAESEKTYSLFDQYLKDIEIFLSSLNKLNTELVYFEKELQKLCLEHNEPISGQ